MKWTQGNINRERHACNISCLSADLSRNFPDLKRQPHLSFLFKYRLKSPLTAASPSSTEKQLRRESALIHSSSSSLMFLVCGLAIPCCARSDSRRVGPLYYSDFSEPNSCFAWQIGSESCRDFRHFRWHIKWLEVFNLGREKLQKRSRAMKSDWRSNATASTPVNSYMGPSCFESTVGSVGVLSNAHCFWVHFGLIVQSFLATWQRTWTLLQTPKQKINMFCLKTGSWFACK